MREEKILVKTKTELRKEFRTYFELQKDFLLLKKVLERIKNARINEKLLLHIVQQASLPHYRGKKDGYGRFSKHISADVVRAVLAGLEHISDYIFPMEAEGEDE